VSSTIQFGLSGLGIGGVYALVALGFHVMWSAAKAVNFAHGDTLMLGAVLTIVFVDNGIPLGLAIALAIAAAVLLGIGLERVAIRPFSDEANAIGWMLTTIAAGIMLESLATIYFGSFARPLALPGSEVTVTLLGAGVYLPEVIIPAAAVLIVLGLTVFQSRTQFGRAMRAVAFDRVAAGLVGINVTAVTAVSFAFAGGLGAVAGILVAPVVQTSATMGLLLGLKGFVVAIVGGIQSAPGVVVAGLLYGVIEKFIDGYISTAAREAIGFSLMILALMIFPQGLFGRRVVTKV
jgi:branched-chain amino acid transport system permease protein